MRTFTGTVYEAKAVILCTGTYLKARCLCGESITYTGPNGLQAANHLTDSLKEMGIAMRRFKTGTPARMDKRSIDFSKMEEQFGDPRVVPFSFSTDPESVQIDQDSCWLTYTNEKTHEIIRANLDRSPIYAGIIEGTGPRYCPSIEDKVVKFADKERHQVFLEPEGRYTNEMYVGGMSSSLPEDVQLAMYRTVPGLENCRIVRNAYAIEYDCIDARQLYPTLEFKDVEGLFSVRFSDDMAAVQRLALFFRCIFVYVRKFCPERILILFTEFHSVCNILCETVSRCSGSRITIDHTISLQAAVTDFVLLFLNGDLRISNRCIP